MLKPKSFKVLGCPFCGGLPEFCRTNRDACWLRCEDCGADAKSAKTAAGAAKNWNMRAQVYLKWSVSTFAHIRNILKMNDAEYKYRNQPRKP